MKKTSDDLFKLVRSLTKSEKGYFVKFAKRYSKSENNSLKLYEAIEKQSDAGDVYDEDIIKKAYAKETFVKQLGVTKIYLYNLILKSLDQYYSEENERAKLTELIGQIKILERKALYKQCHKLIKKAKEIAYKYEIMPRMLDLLLIEKNLIMNGPAKDQTPKRSENYKDQQIFLRQLENFMEYNWLSDRMVILAEKRSEIDEEQRKKEIEEIHAEPLMISEDRAITTQSKVHFYNTNILYCLSKNDFGGAQALIKKQLFLSEETPERIAENPRNYIVTLLNFILFSNIIEKQDDLKSSLEKMEIMRNKYKNKIPRDLDITISVHATNIELLMYNRAGDLAGGKIASKRSEDLLKEYNEDIPYGYKITLLYNLASQYFLSGDHNNSLRIMNDLLNGFSGDVKPEMYTFAKIFNLIIHLELEHNELLEYIANTTYRFLKERKRLYKTETLFLKLIKQILQVKDKAELLEAYKEFKFNVTKVKEEQTESKVFIYFDFAAWAESKITGRPMSELIAEYKKAV